MDAPAALSRKPERLPLLDGMRGIAALVVLNYHASAIKLIDPVFTRGYLFVDFFFLLSGFVLALAAEPRLRQGLSAPTFLTQRVRRLWPVMAIGVAIATLPLAQNGNLVSSLALVVMAFLLLPALDRDGLVFPFNGPQWSLLLELVANAMHAAILVRLGRRGLFALVAVTGLVLAGAIAAHGANDLGASGRDWWLGIARVLYSYGFGVLLARERQSGHPLGRLKCRWTVAVVLPVLAVVGLPLLPLPRAVGDIAVTLIVLPACFAFAVNAELPARFVPTFAGLGLLSYPLYATHLPILTVVSMNLPREAGAWIGPALALFAAAGIAHLLEVPRGWRRSRPVAEGETRPSRGLT